VKTKKLEGYLDSFVPEQVEGYNISLLLFSCPYPNKHFEGNLFSVKICISRAHGCHHDNTT